MREKNFGFWSINMEISINTKTKPRFQVKAYFHIYWMFCFSVHSPWEKNLKSFPFKVVLSWKQCSCDVIIERVYWWEWELAVKRERVLEHSSTLILVWPSWLVSAYDLRKIALNTTGNWTCRWILHRRLNQEFQALFVLLYFDLFVTNKAQNVNVLNYVWVT
jgi:hypothetical protein